MGLYSFFTQHPRGGSGEAGVGWGANTSNHKYITQVYNQSILYPIP